MNEYLEKIDGVTGHEAIVITLNTPICVLLECQEKGRNTCYDLVGGDLQKLLNEAGLTNKSTLAELAKCL